MSSLFVALLLALFVPCWAQIPNTENSSPPPVPTIDCKGKEIANCITCTGTGPVCKTCDNGYGPKYPDLSACYDCVTELGKTNTSGFNCGDIMCNILMVNCQKCTADGNGCEECALGSHRVGGRCVQCEGDRMGKNCADKVCYNKVISHCSECTGNNKASCKSCDEDYRLTSEGLCEPCPEGTGGDSCRQKQCDGFAIYDCKTCGPANSMLCRECNDDYKLDVYDQAIIDDVLVNLGKCVACPSGRSGHECAFLKCGSKLLENCTSCGQTGKCGVCFDGYAPDTTGVCVPCESGMSGVNCIVRQCGFNKFEGCAECDQTDPNACKRCNTGYFKTYTLTDILYESCVECPLGCAECTSLDKCTSCLKDYSGTTCTMLKCGSKSVENCVQCGGLFTKKCTQCRDIATLVNDACVLKDCGMSHCAECTTEGTPTCTKCEDGYYLNPAPSGQQDICISCAHIPGCMDCDTNGTCLICAPNASPGPTGGPQCIFCESITLGCATCVGETGTCTDCKQGMLLYNGQCLSCQSHCLKCLPDGRCLGCETGYYVSETQACVKCMDNCAVCSSPTSCGSCAPGYFLSTANDTSTCLRCIENCAECKQVSSTSFECTECESGYYLDANVCTKCLPHCELCEAEFQCSACAQGFYLTLDTTSSPITMVCRECDSNCEICSLEKTSGQSVCEKAADGYYLTESKTVEKCIENCLSCDSGTQCNLAMDGYYYNSAKASVTQCPGGCRLCIEKKDAPGTPTCYECAPGYQMSSLNGTHTCASPNSSSGAKAGLITGIIITIIVLILVAIAVVFLIRLRKKMDREDALLHEQTTTLIPDDQEMDYQESEGP